MDRGSSYRGVTRGCIAFGIRTIHGQLTVFIAQMKDKLRRPTHQPMNWKNSYRRSLIIVPSLHRNEVQNKARLHIRRGFMPGVTNIHRCYTRSSTYSNGTNNQATISWINKIYQEQKQPNSNPTDRWSLVVVPRLHCVWLRVRGTSRVRRFGRGFLPGKYLRMHELNGMPKQLTNQLNNSVHQPPIGGRCCKHVQPVAESALKPVLYPNIFRKQINAWPSGGDWILYPMNVFDRLHNALYITRLEFIVRS